MAQQVIALSPVRGVSGIGAMGATHPGGTTPGAAFTLSASTPHQKDTTNDRFHLSA